jgi:hypothetical protein
MTPREHLERAGELTEAATCARQRQEYDRVTALAALASAHAAMVLATVALGNEAVS